MCVGATGATVEREQEFVRSTPTALSQLYACESAIRDAFVLGFTFFDGLHAPSVDSVRLAAWTS